MNFRWLRPAKSYTIDFKEKITAECAVVEDKGKGFTGGKDG
jgi:hypothetical protein